MSVSVTSLLDIWTAKWKYTPSAITTFISVHCLLHVSAFAKNHNQSRIHKGSFVRVVMFCNCLMVMSFYTSRNVYQAINRYKCRCDDGLTSFFAKEVYFENCFFARDIFELMETNLSAIPNPTSNTVNFSRTRWTILLTEVVALYSENRSAQM